MTEDDDSKKAIMQRLLELLFGAEHTPVPDGAEAAVDFNPATWMGSDPRFVNVALVLLAVECVMAMRFGHYRRAEAVRA